MKKANPTHSPKKLAIIQEAARRGLSLADLAPGAAVSFGVFYKVVRGYSASARVDAYLCSRLEITAARMRRLNKESKR